MATRLEEFRNKYPQYDDMDDDTLLRASHKKDYSDVDYDTFAGRMNEPRADQTVAGGDDDGIPFSDAARALGSGVLEGGAAVVEGVGEMSRKSIQAGLDYSNLVLGTELEVPNPLAPFARPIRAGGEALREGISEAGRTAMEGATPEGNIFKGEFSLKDPTLGGVLLQGASVAGQLAPALAGAVATKNLGAAEQILATAGITAAQTGGAAEREESERIRNLPQQELNRMPGYIDRVAEGLNLDEAREQLAVKTGRSAFNIAAPVGAGSGLLLGGGLSKPVQNFMQRLVGQSAVARGLATAAAEAPLEGAQEVAEGLAQRYGGTLATGEDRELGEGTAAEFGLGALGGGIGGSLGGFQRPDIGTPAGETTTDGITEDELDYIEGRARVRSAIPGEPDGEGIIEAEFTDVPPQALPPPGSEQAFAGEVAYRAEPGRPDITETSRAPFTRRLPAPGVEQEFTGEQPFVASPRGAREGPVSAQQPGFERPRPDIGRVAQEVGGTVQPIDPQALDEATVAPAKELKAAADMTFDEIETERTQLNKVTRGQPKPKEDDFLAYLAKKGGLNKEAWTAEFLDPHEFKQGARNRKVVGKPLFRKEGGLRPEDLLESMLEDGFFPDQDPDAPLLQRSDDTFQFVEEALANEGQSYFGPAAWKQARLDDLANVEGVVDVEATEAQAFTDSRQTLEDAQAVDQQLPDPSTFTQEAGEIEAGEEMERQFQQAYEEINQPAPTLEQAATTATVRADLEGLEGDELTAEIRQLRDDELLERAGFEAPITDEASGEFLDPHQARVAQGKFQREVGLEEDRRALDFTDEQVAVLRANQARRTKVEEDRDPTFKGFFRRGERHRTVQRAQKWAGETGRKAIYIEADIRNLGGLNAVKGTAGADAILNETGQTMLRAMQDIGADKVIPIRRGGDEISFVVIGGDPAAIQTAIDNAEAQVAELAEAEGLTDLAHTKEGRLPGYGIIGALSEIGSEANIESVYGLADTVIEERKKTHGQQTTTETPGAVAPGEQAGRVGEGIAPEARSTPEGTEQPAEAEAAEPTTRDVAQPEAQPEPDPLEQPAVQEPQQTPPLNEITIEYETISEDGERVTVTGPADQALAEVDKQIDNVRKLRECLLK